MKLKQTLAVLCLSVAGSTLVFAASAPTAPKSPKAPTAQQVKMKTCNKEAAGKKGDERKKFMSDCLKAQPTAPTTG